MSAYKYVTAEGALRYLRTWALRVTPADQFNDPFEMRPRFEISASRFMEGAPAAAAQAIATQLAELLVAEGLGERFADVTLFSSRLASFFIGELTEQESRLFLQSFEQAGGDMQQLIAMKAKVEDIYSGIMANAQAKLPGFSLLAQQAMHKSIPNFIGVLCLSGSAKHPLMWAHYAESHRGALLEFDETAPCFNRRRNGEDEFGYLRRVWYSDSRPTLSDGAESDVVVALALTKALLISDQPQLHE